MIRMSSTAPTAAISSATASGADEIISVQLGTSWGVEHHPSRKTVWAERHLLR